MWGFPNSVLSVWKKFLQKLRKIQKKDGNMHIYKILKNGKIPIMQNILKKIISTWKNLKNCKGIRKNVQKIKGNGKHS